MALSGEPPCKSCLSALPLQAGTAPKQQASLGTRKPLECEASAADPPSPLFFFPSFLPWSFLASTLSHHHPDPSLASFPDMFFPLRSLHLAKSLVSSHLRLSADALISLWGRVHSLCSCCSASTVSSCRATFTGRTAARMWGPGGLLHHLRSR